MVERKKTGRAKARKGVSSFDSLRMREADFAVHLGQALIGSTQVILHRLRHILSYTACMHILWRFPSMYGIQCGL
jgi:hypothetical protein